jgi:3-hydroxyacyl-CoA dehydrogenase
MGAGIAITLAEGGFDVHILDVNPAALERGLAHCRTIWERRMAKGQIAIEQCEALVLRVQGVQEYEQIADCDLVIEAVVEQMDVKKAVFAALDKALKPGAILATNTSTLNVDEIAEVTNRPSDVIGLHFFSPANIMQLLEIVRGKKTAPDVLASALALAKKIRKIPVVSGVCDGFIGNRMVDRYVAQAMYLIEEGATPQQVDQALERWGMAMGPFRMNDIVGNDVPWDGRKHRRAQNPDTKFPSIADEICERGWFGQKTGLGWYKYFPNQRKAEPNPELQDILSALSAKLGVTRREITDEEIVQRCIFALVNEAAAILDEGIAQRGSDIDVAYIFGYGFPRFRGGPLFFADHFGLYAMIRRMRQFTKCHGDPDVWTPYPLLVSLADAEQKISNYEVPT